jgi:arsenate reductase
VLGLIRNSGEEPVVIEYLKTPPSRETLVSLIRDMGMTPRELLREKGTPYHELGLDDSKWTDAQLVVEPQQVIPAQAESGDGRH